MSSMGGAPPASPPGCDSTLADELSRAAMGPYTSTSWSDLPSDILLSILQRLELPQALAFASVCTSWCSAARAAGVPRSCTPWIVSWADILDKREVQGKLSSSLTCNFRHLLDVDKAYDVSFPPGCFVACCGASHGWLILVNEVSNLVLYNPFTLASIPLPPITNFACVKAVCGSGGNLECYLFEKDRVHDANSIGTWFYQKAVLSGSPSKSGDYVVMIIHRDSDWLSVVRAGESNWQVASTLVVSGQDRYADCAYHDGRFYTVTLRGIVEKWDLDAPNGPTKEVIVAGCHHAPIGPILTRHLVSTPWGDLLQVRAILTNCKRKYPDSVRFRIRTVEIDGCKKLSRRDLKEHAMFLGLNHSACLPTKSFPGLIPRRIYFTAPWMTQTFHRLRGCHGWGGVRTYDLKRRTFEHVFPFSPRKGLINSPSEVWITPNM